VTLFFLSL